MPEEMIAKDKRMTLVLPVFKDFEPGIDDTVLLFPETERTPHEQVEFIRAWFNRNRDANNITVISTSSYIFQALINFFEDYFFDEQIVYSDGEKLITQNNFWVHQSKPMLDIFH